MSFELPALPYAYDALAPHIDAQTMEIHHSKHHNGYTTNLNAAIKGTPLEGQSIEDILTKLDLDNKAVRNNGGGFYNHRLFWEIMSPDGGGARGSRDGVRRRRGGRRPRAPARPALAFPCEPRRLEELPP